MSTEVVIIILSLLFSAFFSGMEIAYVSSNKIHIEIEKKQENFLANILTRLTVRPSKFIATMLIGNNIALVIYGFFMGDLLVEWFQSMLPTQSAFFNYMLTDLSLLSQTIISTLIILITAEFLPKVFFQIYSNTFLKLFAIPAYIFYVLFSLVSEFVIWISDVVLKKFFKKIQMKNRLMMLTSESTLLYTSVIASSFFSRLSKYGLRTFVIIPV